MEKFANVTNNCLQMAQVLGVYIIDVVNCKMYITEKKYSIEKAKGVSTKYDIIARTKEHWDDAKILKYVICIYIDQ